MSKKGSENKSFEPGRRTEENMSMDENKGNARANVGAERNTSSGKKMISKKTVAVIACICVAVVALSVALPIGIIFGKKTTIPEPYFDNFNDETDFYVRAKWNKIRNAGLYECQYCYGDPLTEGSEIKNVQTTNTNYPFPRHKGKIAFRVKARIAGEKTDFSEWIHLDVSAWTLQAPVVTITDNLDMSWVPSTFQTEEGAKTVEGYEYEIYVDEKQVLSGYSDTNRLEGQRNFFINKTDDNVIKNQEKVLEYMSGEEWQNFDIELRVRAVIYTKFATIALKDPKGDAAILESIYQDSDFSSAALTITEEIYKQLVE